jgi:hypothetical protein
MPQEKLIRILSYVWVVTLFSVAVGVIAGSLGHNFALGVKALLLIASGIAVLSPLLGAVLGDSRRSGQRRRKKHFRGTWHGW